MSQTSTDTAALRELWRKVTGEQDEAVFVRAMDPRAPGFAEIWDQIISKRAERVVSLVSQTAQKQIPGEPVIARYLGMVDELLLVRARLLEQEQEPTPGQPGEAEQAGDTTQSEQEPAAGGSDRDTAVGLATAEAASRGFTQTLQASRYQDTEVKLSTAVARVSPGAALSVGMDPERAAAVDSQLGGTRRVDRASQVLLDLLNSRAMTNMAAAGITLAGTGRVARGQIPLYSLVNAALVLALRAGGTTGIELNDEGELLVELLGGSVGDVARSASLDANFAEIARELVQMRKEVRISNARSIQARDDAQVAAAAASFGLAERLRLVRIPTAGPEVLESVDVSTPVAVSLLDKIRGQVLDQARREREDEGRMMTGSKFRQRRQEQEAAELARGAGGPDGTDGASAGTSASTEPGQAPAG